MVSPKALNTLLGFSAVVGLLSGLIFIAFVASWAPWRTYEYSTVECVIRSVRSVSCCEEELNCESEVVAFEVERAGNLSNVLGLYAPYGGPQSLDDAGRLLNASLAGLGEVSMCSAPTDAGALDRVLSYASNVGNLTGCTSLPTLGDVVYVDAAQAAEFERTFLGVWLAFLAVLLASLAILVVAAVLSQRQSTEVVH